MAVDGNARFCQTTLIEYRGAHVSLAKRTPSRSPDRPLEWLGERAKVICQLGILRIINRTGDDGNAVMVERVL
jgi:hypothetical protein